MKMMRVEARVRAKTMKPVEWSNRLRSIHVDNFTSHVGITFEIGNEAREMCSKCFLLMKFSML